MFLSLNLPNIPEREPYPLDFRQLPPNHNPIICDDATDTFDNAHATLKLLIQLLQDSEHMELKSYTERETRGLLCILECLADAIKFELYHRVEADIDDDAEKVTENTEPQD